MRGSAVILLSGLLFELSGLVYADSVTCDIPSPLTGSCSSQATAGVTVTGIGERCDQRPGGLYSHPGSVCLLLFPARPGALHCELFVRYQLDEYRKHWEWFDHTDHHHSERNRPVGIVWIRIAELSHAAWRRWLGRDE